jgi:flagellar motor switch protein FliM
VKQPAVKHRAVKRRRAVRRIPLKSLEALCRAEVELGNKLLSFLPAPVPGERLLDELSDEIERLVGAEHDVFYHTMRTYSGSEFDVRLDELFVTTLRLAPDPDEVVLAADMILAGSWLEELLEDEPPEARTLAPPSPRDFGLATFVLMQLVNWLCQRGLPPLSMPSAAPDLEMVAQKLRRQSEIAEVVFAVSSPQAAGLVRIFVPADMVTNMEVFVTEASRRDRSRKRLMMTRLGSLRAPVTATLGVVRLRGDELGSLGCGDILIPNEHGLHTEGLQAEGLQAEGLGPDDRLGRLALGAGASHYLPCELRRCSDLRWQVEICDTTPIQLPNGDAMSTEQTGSNEAKNTGVLDKTEVEVEIRVGMLPLPVSMLAEIQAGYVLEMGRSIDEGVDLVVDGEAIGRGELVNVDGKLGVRVLSIGA